MSQIDNFIRTGLLKKAKTAGLGAGKGCLSESELAGYLSGGQSNIERIALEGHLAGCFGCLERLVKAYEGEKRFRGRRLKQPPQEIIWRAKNIDRIGAGFKQATTEKAVKKWLPKDLRKNKWLIASITAFVLSFAFPPVFLQFLLASGILGGKWIFDSENAKTLIMIYNAWKKGGDKETGEMLRTLKNRLPHNTRNSF